MAEAETVNRNIPLTFNKQNNPVVWLTWALRSNGLVELRAISLTQRHVRYVRAACRDPINWPGVPTVRFWTEKREAEHMLGLSMYQDGLAMRSMVQPKPGWTEIEPDPDGPVDVSDPRDVEGLDG